MFASIGEAELALRAYFNEAQVQMLLDFFEPAIEFGAIEGDGEPALGGTRIGGLPDLPKGEPWPAGGTAREHMTKQLPMPFQFYAQVDLTEAASLGDVATELPDEGRLLFFYDGPAGSWKDTGENNCRVIWDKTPASALERKALPQQLFDLHAEELTSWVGVEKMDGPLTGSMKGSSYCGPARPMRLGTALRLPHPFTVEAYSNDELKAALEDEDGDFEASYDALFDDTAWNKKTRGPRHQLLGSPLPEQDDPRYEAVAITEFGQRHLTREEWRENSPRIEELARKWRLLLQLDWKDYLQSRFADGTIYFLIRRDDLAARAFDRVVAIYQST